MPVWPNTLEIAPLPPGQFPLFTNIRVTARDYENPRITTANIAYEQEIATDWAAYFDFTWSKGDHLSQFLNYNSPTARGAPFGPQFGDVFVHTSLAEGKYRGATFGLRKRLSNRYQLEANYVLSKDEDSDSSERDPFTDRTESSQGGCQCDLALDQLHRNYSYSDRDIRHKFNFFGYGEAGPLRFNARVQARSAQPITPTPRFVGGQDLGRNSSRKENEYFSLDWRVMWPIRFGGRYELIPMIEMFNTFNNANNINPLITPALINFDGFLRLGVGDPRQVQLAAKLRF